MSNSKLPPVKFAVGDRVFHLTYGWGVISGFRLDYTYAHLDDGSNPVVQSSGHRYVLTAAAANLLGLVDPKGDSAKPLVDPKAALADSWNPFEKGRVNLDLLSPNLTKPAQAEITYSADGSVVHLPPGEWQWDSVKGITRLESEISPSCQHIPMRYEGLNSKPETICRTCGVSL